MADMSENERLRNEIRKLTDAIENAKSKQSSRGRRGDNLFLGRHAKTVSYPRNDFTSYHYTQQVKHGWKQADHTFHPYSGKLAPHKMKDTFRQNEFNHGKDLTSNSAFLLSKDRNTVSTFAAKTNYLNSVHGNTTASRYQDAFTSTKRSSQLSVDEEQFQQKVEKMKSSIAELQKALKERQLSSAVQQNTSTKLDTYSSVYNFKPSEILTNNNVQKPSTSLLNLLHKPNSPVKSATCLPVKSQYSDYNPQHSKVFSNSDNTEHSPKQTLNDAKSSTFVSNSDCHSSDTELVSISKYKLTRLNSSPVKSNNNHSVGGRTVSNLKSGFLQQTSFKPPFVSADGKEPVPMYSNVSSLHKKSNFSLHQSKGTHGQSTSNKKTRPVKSTSKTPTKFISLSKYAIKRVRRSLSDESANKSSSTSETVNRQLLIKPEATFTSYKFGSFHHRPVFKDVKNYKHDLSYKLRNQYTTRKSLYKSKYQSPWNQQIYWSGYGKKLWKNGYKFNAKTHGNMGRGMLHKYKARSNHSSFARNSSRLATKHNIWNGYAFRRIQQLKQKIPFNPKHRLDRRTTRPFDESVGFVVINGLLYKSNSKKLVKATVTPSSLVSTARSNTKPVSTNNEAMVTPMKNVKTVTVRGVKFKVDKNGKSLKRISHPDLSKDNVSQVSSSTKKAGQVSRVDIGGVTYMQTKPGTLERVNSVKSRVAAVRVVNKTIHAASKFKKENRKTSGKRKFCMFYNRFGKCNRKEKCPYIHDPDKIAVCTRFLRGTCKSKDCPFSHKVSENKVPTCSFFLQGKCSRVDCPYPHVNVNKKAAVCDDFLKGFCPSGLKCKKKHILQCPEYFHTGICSDGKDCKLQHKNTKETKNSRSRQIQSTESLQQECSASVTIKDNNKPIGDSLPSTSTPNTDENESTSPLLGKRKLPAYISLKSSVVSPVVQQNESNTSKSEKVVLKIRPQFV